MIRRLDLDQLLVFFGSHLKLGSITEWGLELTKHQINVDMSSFETSAPGIYAGGDICHYPDCMDWRHG